MLPTLLLLIHLLHTHTQIGFTHQNYMQNISLLLPQYFCRSIIKLGSYCIDVVFQTGKRGRNKIEPKKKRKYEAKVIFVTYFLHAGKMAVVCPTAVSVPDLVMMNKKPGHIIAGPNQVQLFCSCHPKDNSTMLLWEGTSLWASKQGHTKGHFPKLLVPKQRGTACPFLWK